MAHRIDTPGATGDGKFKSGPAGGTGTVVGPKWLDMAQEEIVVLVEAAGIPLDDTDHNQVLKALGPLLGRWITLPAPYAVVVGDGALVGDTFGVAAEAAAAGADVQLVRKGQHTLAAVSADEWTAGARLFWDDAQRKVTDTATGNRAVGVAAADKAAAAASASVMLDGVALA
ncbi:MAG: DUF2190 family protein [Planctomycetota bacterium]